MFSRIKRLFSRGQQHTLQAKKPETVEELEEKIAAQFPADYKNFLKQIEKDQPALHGGPWLVHNFHHLASENSYDDLYRNYLIALGEIPKQLFPVAHDPGGNLYCIAVKGEHRGKIFLIDHEQELDGNSPFPSDEICLVADDINEFLVVTTNDF